MSVLDDNFLELLGEPVVSDDDEFDIADDLDLIELPELPAPEIKIEEDSSLNDFLIDFSHSINASKSFFILNFKTFKNFDFFFDLQNYYFFS